MVFKKFDPHRFMDRHSRSKVGTIYIFIHEVNKDKNFRTLTSQAILVMTP